MSYSIVLLIGRGDVTVCELQLCCYVYQMRHCPVGLSDPRCYESCQLINISLFHSYTPYPYIMLHLTQIHEFGFCSISELVD